MTWFYCFTWKQSSKDTNWKFIKSLNSIYCSIQPQYQPKLKIDLDQKIQQNYKEKKDAKSESAHTLFPQKKQLNWAW
jgi:hypothetical protein